MAGSRDVSTIIKIWLFPSIVTLLGTLIWRDMQEMRNDIKALLAQSNIDKTRIDNLERQMDFINQKVLIPNSRTTSYIQPIEDHKDSERRAYYVLNKNVAILNPEKKRKVIVNLKRKTNDFNV